MVTINRQFLIKIKVPRKLFFSPPAGSFMTPSSSSFMLEDPMKCFHPSTWCPSYLKQWEEITKAQHIQRRVWLISAPKNTPTCLPAATCRIFPSFQSLASLSLFYLLCPWQSSQVQTKWPQSSNKETNPAPAISYLTVGMRMLHWLYCLAMKPSS